MSEVARAAWGAAFADAERTFLQGEAAEDAAMLTDAVAQYRAALALTSRDFMPREWGLTQTGLGRALRVLSVRTDQ